MPRCMSPIAWRMTRPIVRMMLVIMNAQIEDAVKYERMIFHLFRGVEQISASTPASLSLTIV